jgi:hypothetical protein
MELPDIVKDFSTVDLKGNEDKILRSNWETNSSSIAVR